MKFIRLFSSLLLFLKFCLVCDFPAVIQKVHIKGTALWVKLVGDSGNNSYWSSQPKVKDTFMGNILTVASIIFGGGTYIQLNSVEHFETSTVVIHSVSCHPLSLLSSIQFVVIHSVC